MKTSFVLATALATFAIAAPAPEADEQGLSRVDNVLKSSSFDGDDELEHFAGSDLSAQAYCGNFSPLGCNNFCGALGYLCWQCTSYSCRCTNSGC